MGKPEWQSAAIHTTEDTFPRWYSFAEWIGGSLHTDLPVDDKPCRRGRRLVWSTLASLCSDKKAGSRRSDRADSVENGEPFGATEWSGRWI